MYINIRFFLLITLSLFLQCHASPPREAAIQHCKDLLTATGEVAQRHPLPRLFVDAFLCAVRTDSARPVVHARNSFHLSAAMWDAYAAFDAGLGQVLVSRRAATNAMQSDSMTLRRYREIAMAHAAHFVLHWRFSPQLAVEWMVARQRFAAVLGVYSSNEFINVPNNESLEELASDEAMLEAPHILGTYIGARIIFDHIEDGSNEEINYAYTDYHSVNPRLRVNNRGTFMQHPNRWQRLDLDVFIGQTSVVEAEYPPFVGPHWGHVKPYALNASLHASATKPGVWLDPGAPPQLIYSNELPDARGNATEESDRWYRSNFTDVLRFSTQLDPRDGVEMDISPASRGDSDVGANNGRGHGLNPVTDRPYEPQWARRGDYTRVLAEFWADGPDSDTPPGHWNGITNSIVDHPEHVWRWRGRGAQMDPFDYMVRLYLALNGALHDSAVAAWGVKGYYDYVRPISALRYIGHFQSHTRSAPYYKKEGWPADIPGLVETSTLQSLLPGARHGEALWRTFDLPVYQFGSVCFRTWRGPGLGVGWRLGGDWVPYQSASFVTPPFAGYVSGHSTFSRAAATILEYATGSRFFPSGMGTYNIEENFLEFDNVSMHALQLQWATYGDAADETALSRIWGGIHPSADDLPGRRIGKQVADITWKRTYGALGGGVYDGDEPHYYRVRCVDATNDAQQVGDASVCSLRDEAERLQTVMDAIESEHGGGGGRESADVVLMHWFAPTHFDVHVYALGSVWSHDGIMSALSALSGVRSVQEVGFRGESLSGATSMSVYEHCVRDERYAHTRFCGGTGLRASAERGSLGACEGAEDANQAELDACGVCGGTGDSCRDCAGEPNGGADYDACGVCGGDSSSCSDCAGVPNGDARYDQCGVCRGTGDSCRDCAGEPNGSADYDACGVCNGDSSTCRDCAGVPNGSAQYDECDVCDAAAPGSSCHDCAGVPNGASVYDACGVCGGDSSSCADCLGVPGGEARVDRCGVCNGDGKSCLDCRMEANGTATYDQCGVCAGNNACVDCMGVPWGAARYDRCGGCSVRGRSRCADEENLVTEVTHVTSAADHSLETIVVVFVIAFIVILFCSIGLVVLYRIQVKPAQSPMSTGTARRHRNAASSSSNRRRTNRTKGRRSRGVQHTV